MNTRALVMVDCATAKAVIDTGREATRGGAHRLKAITQPRSECGVQNGIMGGKEGAAPHQGIGHGRWRLIDKRRKLDNRAPPLRRLAGFAVPFMQLSQPELGNEIASVTIKRA